MKKVVILKIDTYDKDVLRKRIEETLKEHFSHVLIIKEGERILLKPNLLMEARPEEAVTTHPAIIEAVVSVLRSYTKNIFLGDSPGGLSTNANMDALYEALGITSIAKKLGVTLLYPDKTIIKNNIPLCWWVEGHTIINMPKLKTHDIAILTLATKNLYGCISGLHKSNLHRLHPQALDFASVIVELYKMITPRLHIVDGILAMQGHGPSKKGQPRQLGIVVIGDDALYTDYVIGRLLGLKEKDHPLIAVAQTQGLLKHNELTVVSEVGERLCSDFWFPRQFILNKAPLPVIKLLRLLFKFRPIINIEKCTQCLKCKEVCPKDAIRIHDKTLFIDHKRCIMCMCCGEMCRFGAVDLDESVLIKIIKKLRTRRA